MAHAEWAGETFDLLPERAAFWRRRRALLVADPHFGKADHFRAAGIPTPDTVPATLARLSVALDATAAAELFILGDFFHAKGGVTPDVIETLRAWRDTYPKLRITVLAGNHDRHAGPPPDCLGMDCVGEQFEVAPFILQHHPPEPPSEASGGYVIAGHIHPAVRLHSAIGHGLRLPCFHFTPRVLTLPAFGDFTGSHAIRPRPGDRVFALGPNTVLDVTPGPTPAPTPA